MGAGLRIFVLEQWSRWLRGPQETEFLDAAMAVAALVSTADGEVRLSEQLGVDAVATRLDELRVTDPRAAADLHRQHVDRISEAGESGRRAALERAARFRGDEHRALLILYVGGVVARADDDLSEAEVAVLHDVRETLALPADALARIWSATGGPRGE